MTLLAVYDQDYEINGTALGQFSGTTAITITGFNQKPGHLVLYVDSAGGVTGTVAVTFKPPGITTAQTLSGNSLTVESNLPIRIGSALVFDSVILTPNVSGGTPDWRLEHHTI